jgi:hypothetical protein
MARGLLTNVAMASAVAIAIWNHTHELVLFPLQAIDAINCPKPCLQAGLKTKQS